MRKHSQTTTKSLRAAGFAGRAYPSAGGSITLEAAIALPLFLFFVLTVTSVLDMIRLQSNMLSALHQTGSRMSYYSFFYRYALSDLLDLEAGDETYDGEMGADLSELGGLAVSVVLSELYVRGQVEEQLGSAYLDHTCLAGGSGGISYLRSSILAGDDCIDLVADYRAKPFFPFPGLGSISLQSRYYGHAWVGYDVGAGLPDHDKEEEEIVYVTPNGTVYHRTRECTYLKPHLTTVTAAGLVTARNDSGACYYACEFCRPSPAATYIITPDGNRYHSSPECHGLRRTVLEIPLKEAREHYPPCSKCGGE